MRRKTKTSKQDTTESLEDTSLEEPKKLKKVVNLKQWFVTAEDIDGSRLQTFLLATCGQKAREFFRDKFPEATLLSVIHSADSSADARWLKTHSPFDPIDF